MTVETLIQELQKYPPHYEVEALYEGIETDDLTSEIVGVSNAPMTKIVSVELLTRLLPEPTPK